MNNRSPIPLRVIFSFIVIFFVSCEKKDPSVHEGHAGHDAGRPAEPAPGSTTGRGGAAIVELQPGRSQQIGIRTDFISVRDFVRTVRAVGIVKVNETRQAHVHLKFPGYIETIHVNFVGAPVRRGQPLFSVYSPELFSTQTEYLSILQKYEKTVGTSEEDSYRDLLSGVEKRLELWDVSRTELDALKKRRTVSRTLLIRSPLNGLVLEKKVLQGMAVSPEVELYLIADLSNVWVQAELYETEVPFIRIGMGARLELESMPGQPLTGTVAFIDPTVSEKTRTTGVRFEFSNPALVLRPGMYATVELKFSQGSGLALPAEAVIDTGSRKLVFVERTPDVFEAREVTLGIGADEYYRVIDGLNNGDRVVTSGQFLLDSESRLRSLGDGGHQGH